jgi:hypothetical protein
MAQTNKFRLITIGNQTFKLPIDGRGNWGEEATAILEALAEASQLIQGPNDVLLSTANLTNGVPSATPENLGNLTFNTGQVLGVQIDFFIRRTYTPSYPETVKITCPPASSITSGQYFLINAGGDVVQYYVWFNKDGAGGNPSVVGKTGIQVDILGTDTSTQVALKLQTALDGLAAFVATISTVANIVICTTETKLATTNASNVNVGGIFAISTTQEGQPSTAQKTITENGIILANYDGADWKLSVESVGDTGIDFIITSSGVVQYTSTDLSGHISSIIRFKAKTIDEAV